MRTKISAETRAKMRTTAIKNGNKPPSRAGTITIITAAWNLEGLKKTIKSINKQTYKDWNHIVINDCNKDIRSELEGLCDGSKRFWVDLGVRTHYYGCYARNIGLMTAFSYLHASERDIDNEWVVFHDDDNLWEPTHLQDMIDVRDNSKNVDISMVATDAKWVGAKDKDWSIRRPCLLKHGGCDLGQFMYKTRLFRDYGYFFAHPGRKHKWDWELIDKFTHKEEENLEYTNNTTFIMNYKKR